MDAALKALSDPTRREILRLVYDAEKPAGEIASHFEMSRPAVSQHLAVLKSADLVQERREGVRRYYQTKVDGMAELREFLEGFWDERLLSLKSVVEAAEDDDVRESEDDDATS